MDSADADAQGAFAQGAQADPAARPVQGEDEVTVRLLVTWVLLLAAAAFLFNWYGGQAQSASARAGARAPSRRDPRKERRAARLRQLRGKGEQLTSEEAVELMQLEMGAETSPAGGGQAPIEDVDEYEEGTTGDSTVLLRNPGVKTKKWAPGGSSMPSAASFASKFFAAGKSKHEAAGPSSFRLGGGPRSVSQEQKEEQYKEGRLAALARLEQQHTEAATAKKEAEEKRQQEEREERRRLKEEKEAQQALEREAALAAEAARKEAVAKAQREAEERRRQREEATRAEREARLTAFMAENGGAGTVLHAKLVRPGGESETQVLHDITLAATVARVKEQVQAQTGVAPAQQTIVFNGTILRDSQCLVDVMPPVKGDVITLMILAKD